MNVKEILALIKTYSFFNGAGVFESAAAFAFSNYLIKRYKRFRVVVGDGITGRIGIKMAKMLNAEIERINNKIEEEALPIRKSGKKCTVDCVNGIDMKEDYGDLQIEGDLISIGFPSFVNRKRLEPKLTLCINEVPEEMKGKAVPIRIIPEIFKNIAGVGDLFLSYKERGREDDKNSSRVLIIGGSRDYHGGEVHAANAAYNALAALRTGAGYVTLAVPSFLKEKIMNYSQNLVIKGCGEDHIEFNETMKKEIERAQVVCIGMALGEEAKEEAKRAINYAVRCKKKVICDAEAIDACKDIKSKEILITPNKREFERYLGFKYEEDIGKRIAETKKASLLLNKCILLKGSKTIICDGERFKVNVYSSQSLATMGSGDVLSGIISALSTKSDLFASACGGAFLHGFLGKLLEKRYGSHIIAKDIEEAVPMGFKLLSKYQ
ncbi:MAG: NAD(P)H-hydrate dehydratase [Candidatus Micrarchaeaceae archaeon]